MLLKKFKFKKVNSTNDIAINLIKKNKKDKGFVISDFQKKGRGRQGNKWISFKGNLFVSVFFKIENINLSLQEFSALNGNLIINLLSFYTKADFKLKSPNDIIVNGKKICGILQETIIVNNIKYLIVGVGLNLIKKPIIKNYPTISLNELTKKNFKIENIVNKLKKIYEIFLKDIYSAKLINFKKISNKYII